MAKGRTYFDDSEMILKQFKDLASQGLNRTEIREKMGYSNNYFGLKMKALLGEYPSIYIEKLKHGKT
jgi:YesN/AraC family two-component response regulator